MNAPQPRESPAFRRGEEVKGLVVGTTVVTLVLLLAVWHALRPPT